MRGCAQIQNGNDEATLTFYQELRCVFAREIGRKYASNSQFHFTSRSHFRLAAVAFGIMSTLKLQEAVPAKADLQDMRLKTDALVSAFNERYRDTILTPSRSSAPHTPNYQTSNQSRLESATVVRFPVSSPSDLVVGAMSTTPHPLSHAPPKNVSPSSMRVQHAPVVPSAPSASSSDFVYVVRAECVALCTISPSRSAFVLLTLPRYFRAMLTQAQAETAHAREALAKRDQQLAQANSQINELRRDIATRDGCLQHANSVLAQLQEHKLQLYAIIDNFRAQQASSKSQLDLQARSLISKERHLFSLTEKIQCLQAESAHHQKSCEEALQFMLQECQSAFRERDTALREVVSLRHQITFSKVPKSASTSIDVGSASRKALLASVDVGPHPEPSVHSISSTTTARTADASSASRDRRAGKDSDHPRSPVRDCVVDFYLAHSHEKQPFAAMFDIQKSPAAAFDNLSPNHSKKKLLDLFGEASSRSSQESSESGHPHDGEALALEQDVARCNLEVSSSSFLRSSGSTPTVQQNSSAHVSNASLTGSSIGKEPRVFANQHRRRSAARSLASKRRNPQPKHTFTHLHLNFDFFCLLCWNHHCDPQARWLCPNTAAMFTALQRPLHCAFHTSNPSTDYFLCSLLFK